jgi:hypothetical protein
MEKSSSWEPRQSLSYLVKKWRWGRFSPRTSVSPANLCSICSPQSSSLSPEAGTIGQEWPQCQ